MALKNVILVIAIIHPGVMGQGILDVFIAARKVLIKIKNVQNAMEQKKLNAEYVMVQVNAVVVKEQGEYKYTFV